MSETTIETTQAESERTGEKTDATIEKTVRTAVDIGRLWAVYGLEIGRAALRTSSETLRATSEILGDISKKIDERREPSADEPAVTTR